MLLTIVLYVVVGESEFLIVMYESYSDMSNCLYKINKRKLWVHLIETTKIEKFNFKRVKLFNLLILPTPCNSFKLLKMLWTVHYN